MVEQAIWSQEMELLLNQPLPLVHRQFGPISIRDGLELLAGSAYELIDDPVNRVVSFKLLPHHQWLSAIVSEGSQYVQED